MVLDNELSTIWCCVFVPPAWLGSSHTDMFDQETHCCCSHGSHSCTSIPPLTSWLVKRSINQWQTHSQLSSDVNRSSESSQKQSSRDTEDVDTSMPASWDAHHNLSGNKLYQPVEKSLSFKPQTGTLDETTQATLNTLPALTSQTQTDLVVVLRS